jgi:hypothetical protein
LIAFIQERFPDSLPRTRAEIRGALEPLGRELLGAGPGPELLPSTPGERSDAPHQPQPTRA